MLGRVRSRLDSLGPALLVIVILGFIDQFLLIYLSFSAGIQNIPPEYDRYERTADPDRPHLIILGSSRGKYAVTTAGLASALREEGLPHQPFNLSMGGGGTPALLHATLKDSTEALSSLPRGSVVVYIFSLFELNFVNTSQMLKVPSGVRSLEEFGYINSEHWAYRMGEVSGFASFAIKRGWASWGLWVQRVLEDSVSPLRLVDTKVRCNATGLANYKVLPINADALEKLLATFGNRLILVTPPVNALQRLEDQAHGLEKKGLPFVKALAFKYGGNFIRDFGSKLRLSVSAFKRNCDHINRPQDRRIVERSIVRLIK